MLFYSNFYFLLPPSLYVRYLTEIKKVDICIKVVCNHYYFYNFILKWERVSLCFPYVIYWLLKKKMH